MSNENPFPGGVGAQTDCGSTAGLAGSTTERMVRLPAAVDQTAAMLPGDVDGDGDLDVVVLNRGQDHLLINNGAGFFTNETSTRFPMTSDSTRAGGLADLDGDGDLGVVTANSRGEAVAIYFNDAGIFKAPIRPAEEPVAGQKLSRVGQVHIQIAVSIDVHELESRDGLVGQRRYPEVARPFRNNGCAQFAERTQSHFTPPDDPTTDAPFGDIDGDGDLDLVVGNSGQNGDERVLVQYSCTQQRCDSRLE